MRRLPFIVVRRPARCWRCCGGVPVVPSAAVAPLAAVEALLRLAWAVLVLSALAAGGARTPPGPALQQASAVRTRRTFDFDWDDEYSRLARSAKKNHSGIVRRRRLYCQTKYTLQILPNGKVNGTRNHTSKFAVLDFMPISRNMLYIKGVSSGLYLCMTIDGRLYGSAVKNFDNCSIVVNDVDNYSTYHMFKQSSHRQRWFISISKNGRARRRKAFKPRNRPKATRFLTQLPAYNPTPNFREEVATRKKHRRKHYHRFRPSNPQLGA